MRIIAAALVELFHSTEKTPAGNLGMIPAGDTFGIADASMWGIFTPYYTGQAAIASKIFIIF